MINRISYLSGSRAWLNWLIVVGAFGGMFVMLLMGQVQRLSVLVIGGMALIFMIRNPMVGLVALLLINLRFYSFIKVDALPYLQVAPSFRLNSQDILMMALLARSLLELVHRRKRPMFLVPLLIFFCVAGLSFLLGLFSGTSDLTLGGRVFRLISMYGIYFIIVATLDSRQRFEIFIKMLYGIAFVALILQFIETIHGHYFVLNPSWDTFFEGGVPYNISFGGSQIAYIWNRAQQYLYITFFLSFACLLVVKRWSKWHLLYASAATLGFVLMLIRSWFIYLGVGFVAIFLSGKRSRLIKYGLILLYILILGTALITLSNTSVTLDGTIIGNWIFRMQTLLKFQEESSFIGRVDLWRVQLTYFQQSLLFGSGPGTTALLALNTDTGLVNTLLLFGIAGLLAIVVIIIAIFCQAYRLWQQVRSSREQAYVLGLVGVMAGIIVGYGFNYDAFTLNSAIPILVMGILDRIDALYIGA